MECLAGRVAVVTGAASGIGRALAGRFVAESMSVVLADVEADALGAAIDELSTEVPAAEVEAVVTDVSDGAAVEALAERTLSRFGAVHLVCNNAGVVTLGDTWEQTAADWRWVIDVDLWGVINGIRTFVPILLGQGTEGHVVNTASIAGLVPSPTIAPYNVAKAGVVAASETLDMELRACGAPIGVSVLCPGVVPTRIAESARNRPAERQPEGAEVGATAVLDIPTQHDLPPTALHADRIAELVVDAVRNDRFWIVTHDGSAELIERRSRAMTSGGRPEAPPVF
jgi:NAD(P)-dependent dehydrogenase (short-subunit alcohol dehydrogenase family)